MKRALLALLLPLTTAAHADTIYLCRAYGGGSFWSNTHCNQQQALVERLASVPAGLPWAQQVQLAEQAGRTGDAMQPQPAGTVTQTHTSSHTSSHTSRQAECMALDARVAHLQALARQPQGGAAHDRIRAEEKRARDRQFELRCS